MSRVTRCAVHVALLLAALAPWRAHAAAGMGVHQWYDHGPLIEAHAAAQRDLRENLALGLRGGAMFEAQDRTPGLTFDAFLRYGYYPIYLEALGGPWLLFKGDLVRAHFAGGVGYQFGHGTLGLEAGTLGWKAIVGLKLGMGF